MPRQLTTVKTEQIKKQFQKETGIQFDGDSMELFDAFPWSYTGTIQTDQQEYQFKLTHEGRAKRGSFEHIGG